MAEGWASTLHFRVTSAPGPTPVNCSDTVISGATEMKVHSRCLDISRWPKMSFAVKLQVS